MEMCKCVGMTQITPNFKAFQRLDKLTTPFLLDTIVNYFCPSLFIVLWNFRFMVNKPTLSGDNS